MKAKSKILFIFLSFLLSFSLVNGQWIQQSFPAQEDLLRVKFANESVGWILGDNHLYKTTDAGDTWNSITTIYGYAKTLFVLSENIVFYSDDATGGIRKSEDGGISWTYVDSSGYLFRDIDFVDTNIGYIVGVNDRTSHTGIIKKTSDGGKNWETVFQTSLGPEGSPFLGVSCIGPDLAWTVSYNGLVYHTSNSGTSWNLQDTVGYIPEFDYQKPVRDIQFTSPDSGWAVGGLQATSVVDRTTNGGITWEAMVTIERIDSFYMSNISSSIQEICMINSHIGWFAGQNYEPTPKITTDGGLNWADQNYQPLAYSFNSICMLNKFTGWAVGDNGDVYKTTNGGILVSVDDNELVNNKTYFLSQNYPNPFNPNTIIEFYLPKNSQVKLSIYNMLGQEVDILINNLINAGRHEAKWNAKNYPSGVYFYKLETDTYSMTKSLVLLK